MFYSVYTESYSTTSSCHAWTTYFTSIEDAVDFIRDTEYEYYEDVDYNVGYELCRCSEPKLHLYIPVTPEGENVHLYGVEHTCDLPDKLRTGYLPRRRESRRLTTSVH